MNATIIIVGLIALGLGALLGWLFASREAAGAKQTVQSLRLQLDEVIEERDVNREAATRLAALEAAQEEREKTFEARLDEIKEAKNALSAQFSEIGGKLLGEAQKAFLDRADARFQQAGEKNEEKLKNLLQPVEATLQRYEKSLGEIEKARSASYGELKEAVAQLSQGNDQVRKETQRLANVMSSSPKARGRWGEEHLKNILESAGLAENIDFALQTSVSDGEQKLRPDCVINLPGERCIVVDVKNVWTAFERAFDEEDPQRRAELLKQHADAMAGCASDLSRKGYWRQFERSPEFVVMFIPGEHILSAAAERAPDMIATAFRNGVIIASTINMLALAKIMAGMWRQETLTAEAKEIASIGKELHARLQTMGSHVFSLGRSLRLATDSYNDFVGSLDRNVLTQAKRFEELKVAAGNKPIVDLPTVEFMPKISTKLAENRDNDSESPQIAAE